MEQLTLARMCGISDEQFKMDSSLNSFGNKTTSIQADIATIVNMNEEKRDNKLKLYRGILKRCVDKMKFENALKRTNMIYYVDDHLYNNRNYNRNECIAFLIEELRKCNLDVKLLKEKLYGDGPFSKSQLYIDWKYSYYHNRSKLFAKTE